MLIYPYHTNYVFDGKYRQLYEGTELKFLTGSKTSFLEVFIGHREVWIYVAARCVADLTDVTLADGVNLGQCSNESGAT